MTYVIRNDKTGSIIAQTSSFQTAVDYADKYMGNYGDAKGHDFVSIYTLSHTVEKKKERVPIEWKTRTTLDVKKV